MKRTQIVREAADALHQAEATFASAVADTQAALERVSLARKQLGLTGTLGDAMIARLTESAAMMREAGDALYEGHREAYRIYEMLDLKDANVVATILPSVQGEDSALAA